ncbi:hypothetical protein EMPS_09764 [Entomortierella parvispora]|uniref:Uncharacterized protein n=1 Tax=Entomortierella parvispora TaxID=205924 RepID=A0A9P3HIX3_9FUNG|nr:hypothetical protein EMPS_09764 [Entomortierella parvispora]
MISIFWPILLLFAGLSLLERVVAITCLCHSPYAKNDYSNDKLVGYLRLGVRRKPFYNGEGLIFNSNCARQDLDEITLNNMDRLVILRSVTSDSTAAVITNGFCGCMTHIANNSFRVCEKWTPKS